MTSASPGGTVHFEPGAIKTSNYFEGLDNIEQMPYKKTKISRERRGLQAENQVSQTNKNISITPKTSILAGPRYLVVHNTDMGKTMQTDSYFTIKMAVDYYSDSKLIEIKKLKNGTLLLKTPDFKTAEKLLKIKKFYDQVNVNIEQHKTLNFAKGIIYCPDLEYDTAETIKKHLAFEGVVDLYREKRTVNGS